MAYEYAISFDLKADSDYSERYKSLMAEIGKTPGMTGVWGETTAFILLRSDEKIDALEHRLYFNTKLNSAKDKLLIIDHASNVAVARGPFQYQATLKAHFKSCVIK